MIKVFKFLLVFATFSALALEPTINKGVIRFKTVFRAMEGAEYFDKDERRTPSAIENLPADYQDSRADLEVIYGLYPDVNLVFSTGYRQRELKTANAAASLENDGVPGLYIGVRQRLSQLGRATRIMAETGVWLPVEADRADRLPLDSGGVDWDLTMSYNQDFLPTSGGFEMDFGYRFRNGDTDNELFFNTNLKLDLRRIAKAIIAYKVVESSDDRKVDYAQTIYPNERGLQTLSGELERSLTSRIRILLGYEKILKGRNVFQTDGWRLSLIWQG